MTGIYRAAINISQQLHQDIGKILVNHYEKLIKSKQWDYHISNKSSTITDLHILLEKNIGDTKEEALRAQAISRILTNLGDCQVLRKNMIMTFYEEMLPFQWYLIIFFAGILIATISIIPSVASVFLSLLKASFAVTVLSVIVILRDLDNLNLFEEFIGENSAKDVLQIISGNK